MRRTGCKEGLEQPVFKLREGKAGNTKAKDKEQRPEGRRVEEQRGKKCRENILLLRKARE